MKTTKKDFAFFEKRVRAWAKYFCVHVAIEVEHDKDTEAYAAARRTFSNQVLHVYLATEWPNRPTKYQLDKSAFHEVFEGALLTDLRWMAEMYFNKDAVDEAAHRAVRTLEHTVFNDLRDKVK